MVLGQKITHWGEKPLFLSLCGRRQGIPVDIDQLLITLTQKKASDLHLKAGAPPIMRKDFKLCILQKDLPAINYQTIKQLVDPILTDIQQEKLRSMGAVDLGYGLKGVGRFRFNIFFQRGTLRVVARHIPHRIPSIQELNLPPEMAHIVDKTERGLILVAGATGVGKSTTLATLINHINQTKNKHIITLEDPIEFLIQDHHSLITQREMEVDFYDSTLALKSALRQDPDIILFSELRSKDDIYTALRAAETGHLIFSTIHAKEAGETVLRILNVFSTEERPAVQLSLASVLQAVFAQRLIPRKKGTGYLPAVEILLNNHRMQNLIENNPSQEKIKTIIEQSRNHYGMQSFDQHLVEMLKKGVISGKDASRFSSSPEKIKMVLAGISTSKSFFEQNEKAVPSTKAKTGFKLSLQNTQANTSNTKANP